MSKEKIYFMGLLANVDSSILNLELDHGFKVESMDNDGIGEVLTSLEGLPHMKLYVDLFMEYRCLRAGSDENVYFIKNEFECDLEKEGAIPKELAEFSNKLEHDYLRKFIRLLRLYKEGNIMLPKRYYYRIVDGIPKTFISGDTSLHIEDQLFTLDPSEIADIKKFTKEIIIPFEFDYLELALNNLELSYNIHNRNLKLLTLMIGMEALFNEGGSEITYKISRNLATLIGNNEKDSEKTFKKMYKKRGLYALRSKIVHYGTPNATTEEDVLVLRDYLRRAIKETYKVGKEKKGLNEMLHASGYDEKPWRKKK